MKQTLISPDTKLDEEKIHFPLEITNIAKYKNKLVTDLSGGQKQRVWTIMVLHDINQSLYYSDEIIAMKDGKIITAGREAVRHTSLDRLWHKDCYRDC